MPKTPQLLQAAERGEAGFFLLFGGQGAGYLDQLRALYADPKLRPLIDLGMDAVSEEAAHVDASIALPRGLALRDWLTDPTTIPHAEYPNVSAISVPMIMLTQISYLMNLHHRGFPVQALLEHAHGITGHSQGLFASCLVGLGRTGHDFEDVLAHFMKYVFHMAARSQEVFRFPEATDEDQSRTDAVSDRPQVPYPLVAVLGCTHAQLEPLVQKANSNAPPDRKIHFNLFHSPTNRILGGHRSSLISFHERNAAWMAERDVKFIYIKSTCPYHSSLMAPVVPRANAAISRLDFGYAGSELVRPVISFFDGRNLQDDDEIALKLYQDVIVNPLYWEKSARAMADAERVTHVIDFGPGTDNQRLTRHVLNGLGSKKPILTASDPTGLAELVA